MIKAARQWQAGDDRARTDVSWSASEYTSNFRQHLDRLKNLIFPLLEQNLSLRRRAQDRRGVKHCPLSKRK